MHTIKYQVINLDNSMSDASIVFDNTDPVEPSYVDQYFTLNFPNLLLVNHQERQVLLGDIGRNIDFLIPSVIPFQQFYLLAPGYDHYILITEGGHQWGIVSNEGFEIYEYPKVEDRKFVRDKVSTFIETPELLNHWLLETRKFKKLIKIS
jgi:hypothetical protein